MNRRQFLLVSATLPLFLRRAFADESCLPVPSVATLAGAYRRAQRSGKALLVFVIPEKDEHKWERGAAFGELLNHGSDAQLAPLSAVEVVCASMAEVRKLVPSAPSGEPLMVAIDTQKVPASARALHTTLTEYGDTMLRGRSDWKDEIAREDRVADERIAQLARLLRPLAVAGDVTAQADEVRARLVKQRVPGSYWANASGCGTSVEGDDDAMRVACGMGHVPSKSSRFLYLYAQTPGQQWRARTEKK